MGRLEGKVTIVTGASGDLGTEIARRCAGEGAAVVLMDLVDATDLAAELGGASVAGDVTEERSWDAAVAAAAARFGGVDVLVNNAAIYERAAMPDVTDENFEAHWRVNVLGVFLGIRACLPAMLERGGGSIVNVGSVAGMHAGPGLFSYAVSKWAMPGIAKAASADLAPHEDGDAGGQAAVHQRPPIRSASAAEGKVE